MARAGGFVTSASAASRRVISRGAGAGRFSGHIRAIRDSQRPQKDAGLVNRNASDQRKRMKAQVARTSVALGQGEGRQFESGRPLQKKALVTGPFSFPFASTPSGFPAAN